MRIPLKSFTGMAPRLEPHLLAEHAAQHASDVVLERGTLAPLRAPAFVADLAKPGIKQTIYRFGKDIDSDAAHWFHFPADADIVCGPVADDTSERTYFTQSGQPPMVTDASIATTDALMPSNAWRLGVPAATTPAAVLVTPGTAQDDERQQCYLAFTFVSAWGEEGAPNEVSAPFNAATGDTLVVSALEGIPAGAYQMQHKRLYVSVTDANGVAILRFWKEIPVGTDTFSAELDITTLGETLPEYSHVPPPDDLFGIMAHPGGFMVGFSGQRVYRSEPFLPYAWPHHSPLPEAIVGGAISGQRLIVCTRSGTWLATTADPLDFRPARLDGDHPCAAKRSIRAFKGGVVYAGDDGLVMVDAASNLSVITEALITPRQWQHYHPASMHAAVHDNRYYCWYDNGTDKGCLILDVSATGVTLTHSSQYATAAFADPLRDALFVALPDGKLYKWDAGHALPFTWTSKRFIFDRPQNLGAVQVVAEGWPVSVTLHALIETDTGQRTVTTTRSVTSARPQRLPAHYRAREYWLTVTSTHTVREITLASTLGNVTAQ